MQCPDRRVVCKENNQHSRLFPRKVTNTRTGNNKVAGTTNKCDINGVRVYGPSWASAHNDLTTTFCERAPVGVTIVQARHAQEMLLNQSHDAWHDGDVARRRGPRSSHASLGQAHHHPLRLRLRVAISFPRRKRTAARAGCLYIRMGWVTQSKKKCDAIKIRDHRWGFYVLDERAFADVQT